MFYKIHSELFFNKIVMIILTFGIIWKKIGTITCFGIAITSEGEKDLSPTLYLGMMESDKCNGHWQMKDKNNNDFLFIKTLTLSLLWTFQQKVLTCGEDENAELCGKMGRLWVRRYKNFPSYLQLLGDPTPYRVDHIR